MSQLIHFIALVLKLHF